MYDDTLLPFLVLIVLFVFVLHYAVQTVHIYELRERVEDLEEFTKRDQYELVTTTKLVKKKKTNGVR